MKNNPNFPIFAVLLLNKEIDTMSDKSNFTIRLSKAAREFNVGYSTIVEFLAKKGYQIDSTPNTKLTKGMYELLVKEYQGEKTVKEVAKKMSNLSYKGGSISVESTFENDKEKNNAHTLPYQKPMNEENDVQKEILIPLNKLHFDTNVISLKIDSIEFILWENDISKHLNSKKKNPFINNVSAKIILNYSNHTFKFLDSSLLSNLKDLSSQLDIEKGKEGKVETEKKEKNIEKEEKKPKKRQNIEVPFSQLRFGQGIITFSYEEKLYVYRDPKIQDYDKTLELIYSKISEGNRNVMVAIASRNAIDNSLIRIKLDNETKSFTFKDIDIHKYVNRLKEIFLRENNKVESRKELPSKDNAVPHNPLTSLKTMMLGAGNIRFFEGYYMIFHTSKGVIDNSIAPCRVNDQSSNETLNLVHKYFEQILEQKRIFIKYDATKVHEPSKPDLFQLSNYVKTLNRNLDIKGEWWEEVQNGRKPSLTKCRSISPQVVKKKVSMKNGYLDNLSSMQSEEKLLSVYEVNHGKEEDAFIFTIDISHDRCAVIFENASNDASTTTWVFVTKKENYEPCVNLVFDYFTDYTIDTKRSTLRVKTVNPPEKFKAEDYTFIVHDDLGQWLKKLNKILEQTTEPSDISFVPGLHIPESSGARAGHGDTITTKHLHNQLMRKLYDKLCGESGKDNVGTEIRVGTKRIDCVVKGDDHYDIYEIKTAESPFECVTEALGQLCQYTYLYCRDKIGKMVIVGASETNKEVEQYLSWFRKSYSLQLYYMKV